MTAKTTGRKPKNHNMPTSNPDLRDYFHRLRARIEAAEQLPRKACSRCHNKAVIDLPEFHLCDKCEVELEHAEQLKQQASELHRQLQQSGIPPRFHNCTLDNYQPHTESQTKALSAIRSSLRPHPLDLPLGVTLTGNPGTGKTHLICAAGIALLKQNYHPLYLTRDMLDPVFWKKESIEHYKSYGAILLDDLTTEELRDPPEHFTSGINSLLDLIYREGDIRLYVTSNLRVGLENGRCMASIFGNRFVSRLKELTTIIHVTGPDHRIS